MAQKTTVTLVSDLSEEEGAETVQFIDDGSVFEIDLVDVESKGLAETIALLRPHARKIGTVGKLNVARPAATRSAARPNSGSSSADREANKAVREWARGEGMEVSERGRIPNDIVEAYAQRER